MCLSLHLPARVSRCVVLCSVPQEAQVSACPLCALRPHCEQQGPSYWALDACSSAVQNSCELHIAGWPQPGNEAWGGLLAV